MLNAYDITLFVYNLTLIPVIVFSVLFIFFCFVNLMLSKEKVVYKKLKELPFVSVQIPTFNDPIAKRCVECCLEFDYPKDKFEIMIVDDSTNEETQKNLSVYAKKYPGFVKYIHRTNRDGFKPGALKDAMCQTKGDVLVVFDADWIPAKDFLKKIVKPFSDPKVAIVQSRQGFYNHKTNLITRFAAYTLMAYHTIVMPINNKINSVFFCGTAGALRRSSFEEVGGWNKASITEDSELSVNLLLKGYKSVYLEFETPSEVPDTFESFIKQQMRWCYGNVRVFMDNIKKIMFKGKLSIKQRLMITYITMGNLIAPIVVVMTFFGLFGWFLGELRLFNMTDLVDFVVRFGLTAGFLSMGLLTLFKSKKMNETKHLVFSMFTMGLVLAVGNSFAFIKAVTNQPLHWFCTEKRANDDSIKK